MVVGILDTSFGSASHAGLPIASRDRALADLVAIVGVPFDFETRRTLVFVSSGSRRIFRFVLEGTMIFAVDVVVIAHLIALGFKSYPGDAPALRIATVLPDFAVLRSSAIDRKRT